MTTWWNDAACLDHDTNEFFPVGTAPPALLQAAAAKQVCSRCPVRDPCLIWALETGADGVWGGLTEDERRSAHAGNRHRSDAHVWAGGRTRSSRSSTTRS